MRCFVCIWIPDELRSKIINFQNKLKNIPMKAKFVEPENFHLTITFLGEKKERELKEIDKKLEKITRSFGKFQVNLEGLKIIPNESYVRVIGIAVKNSENLKSLIKLVGREIDGSYYENSKLTLCRVKNVFEKEKLKEFIEENKSVKIGEFLVNSISLVKSTLTREGPIYQTIKDYELV